MRTPAWILVLTLNAAPALAGPTPDDDPFDWVTVSDVLNRDVLPEEAPGWFPKAFPDYHIHAGGVDYPYRIMRTLVTNEQWHEFVVAFYPHWDGFYGSTELTGLGIYGVEGDDGVEFFIVPGLDQHAASGGWHMAARYCNWLHNGRINEAWAFESGVYDASTFTQNKDGSWNSSLDRAPGAGYWIPTISEYAKALYWDPEKDGTGGYWQFPDSGDDPLIPGLPEDGGETAAGMGRLPGDFGLPVGSYSHVASYWGVTDLSGVAQQWLAHTSDYVFWTDKSSDPLSTVPDVMDRLSYFSAGLPIGHSGIRLVSPAINGCRVDVAEPDGILDFSDVLAFIDMFCLGSPGADIAEPEGVINYTDVVEFLSLFSSGAACK